jgi:FkbM family methyltransferase
MQAWTASLSLSAPFSYSDSRLAASSGTIFGIIAMRTWTFEELHAENEKNALGLQYTIAERERRDVLWRMAAERLTPENAPIVAKIMLAMLETPAERFQDIFALLLTDCKRDGFFVEFGACDGLAANNTVTLERKFGWDGILAEPLAFWHDRLRKERTARLDFRCVSGRTGDEIEFFQSEMPGNSSAQREHAYLGQVRDSYKVPTVSLMDLLKEHKAPRHIDFLSCDVEGHEKAVLSAFDWDEYTFGFICVEQHEQVAPEDDVRPLMDAAGYQLILPRTEGRPVPMEVTGVDLFFIPKRTTSPSA